MAFALLPFFLVVNLSPKTFLATAIAPQVHGMGEELVAVVTDANFVYLA